MLLTVRLEARLAWRNGIEKVVSVVRVARGVRERPPDGSVQRITSPFGKCLHDATATAMADLIDPIGNIDR
jgi:hypothetical protein